MIKAVIIDDESTAINTLRILLNLYCKEVVVLGEAKSPATGIQLILDLKPDLIFLDIKMRTGTGFDVLNALPGLQAKVIFVSAYTEPAHLSVQFAPVGYLLKPISIQQLCETIERYKVVAAKAALLAQVSPTNLTVAPKSSHPEIHILVPEMDGHRLVLIAEIVRCEASRNYSLIYLVDGKTITSTKSIGEIQTLLMGHPFLRVHRSHIVHLQFIEKIYRNYTDGLLMRDGKDVPISRTRFLEIRRRFWDHLEG